jgi:hemerythrin-like domain-containing protein
MKSTALKIIQDEHQALAAMLQSLVMMAKRSTEETTAGDFEVMRAMLFYIVEFPEKLHHTKESESLFPLVAARSPQVRQVIKELDEQHDQGEKAVSHLMNLLIAWEMMGDLRRIPFLEALEKYKDFYMEHMRTEMNVVIPVAQEVLSHDDWALLDSVFEANQDPMIGHQPTKEFDRLFKHVLSNAPQPIGLGRL